MSTQFFESHSAQETRELGRKMAGSVKAGDILLLRGDLASGKTCFCSGLANGLGFEGDVSSPTFTLINEYKGGRLPLYHIDLYRVESKGSVEGLGLEEYFEGPGVCVVEWPERLQPGQEPFGAWKLKFEHLADGRGITTDIP